MGLWVNHNIGGDVCACLPNRLDFPETRKIVKIKKKKNLFRFRFRWVDLGKEPEWPEHRSRRRCTPAIWVNESFDGKDSDGKIK